MYLITLINDDFIQIKLLMWFIALMSVMFELQEHP